MVMSLQEAANKRVALRAPRFTGFTRVDTCVDSPTDTGSKGVWTVTYTYRATTEDASLYNLDQVKTVYARPYKSLKRVRPSSVSYFKKDCMCGRY